MGVGALSQQLIALLAGQRGGGPVSSPQDASEQAGESEMSESEVGVRGEDSVLNQVLAALVR